MPFNAPTSVPQITYASFSPQKPLYYPLPEHSTFTPVPYPPPTQRDVHTNRKLNLHFVSIKAALLSILRTRHLPNLPLGFPFRYVCVPSGRADASVPHMSHSSYEFLEYVVVDPMSPPCCAVFSYTNAYRCDPATYGESPSKMTWRIKIPSLNSMTPNDPRTFVTISQVDVDPEIMETPFGYEFMTDKDMLLEALSISLEHGLHITVQFALTMPCGSDPSVTTENCHGVYKPRNSLGYESDVLVFVAKKNNGQREVVHVYDPCVRIPRKS